MSKIQTTFGVINIPFPEEKFTSQLEKVGVSSEEKLTFSMLAQLMVNSIGDFKKGEISLDDLSGIFRHLRWEGFFSNQPEDLQSRFFELGNVLDQGAELSFYNRHAVVEGKPSDMFLEFLHEVTRFYDKREAIQANIAEMEKEEK